MGGRNNSWDDQRKNLTEGSPSQSEQDPRESQLRRPPPVQLTPANLTGSETLKSPPTAIVSPTEFPPRRHRRTYAMMPGTFDDFSPLVGEGRLSDSSELKVNLPMSPKTQDTPNMHAKKNSKTNPSTPVKRELSNPLSASSTSTPDMSNISKSRPGSRRSSTATGSRNSFSGIRRRSSATLQKPTKAAGPPIEVLKDPDEIKRQGYFPILCTPLETSAFTHVTMHKWLTKGDKNFRVIPRESEISSDTKNDVNASFDYKVVLSKCSGESREIVGGLIEDLKPLTSSDLHARKEELETKFFKLKGEIYPIEEPECEFSMTKDKRAYVVLPTTEGPVAFVSLGNHIVTGGMAPYALAAGEVHVITETEGSKKLYVTDEAGGYHLEGKAKNKENQQSAENVVRKIFGQGIIYVPKKLDLQNQEITTFGNPSTTGMFKPKETEPTVQLLPSNSNSPS